MKRMGTFLAIAVFGYAGICVLVFFLQDRMLFFPRPSDPSAVEQLSGWQRNLESSGVSLSGWVIPARDPENAPLVFYYGGNGEDVALTAREFDDIRDANVVLMSYRGYGASDGSPSERALFTDALSAYDRFADTPSNGKIAAFGRSLGSGVAVHLATQRRIDALVLVTPYDSVRSVAHHHFPWLPVSLMISHPFDSLTLAANLRVPALFVVAEHDEVIPVDRARNLADSWGGSTSWVMIAGTRHNTIGFDTSYWPTINSYLNEL